MQVETLSLLPNTFLSDVASLQGVFEWVVGVKIGDRVVPELMKMNVMKNYRRRAGADKI